MVSKIELLKKEMEALLKEGELLLYALGNEFGKLPDSVVESLKQSNTTLPSFYNNYEPWYSESLQVIKQIIPDRLDDFVNHYKINRRKEIDYETYRISDHLRQISVKRGTRRQVVIDGRYAIPSMQNQLTILRSVYRRFTSSLFDIKDVLQSDIFDSELDAAKVLNKQGFTRGAGAMAGVVLEKHLAHVCEQHKLKPARKNPTIFVLNQLLQDNNIIDIAQSRFIQRLGDLRNLCDHDRETEPTQDHVNDLIEGTDKVIKTVF